jgi:4-cresol dehydrogenase (hydroxylating) flavoprotein subunit
VVREDKCPWFQFVEEYKMKKPKLAIFAAGALATSLAAATPITLPSAQLYIHLDDAEQFTPLNLLVGAGGAPIGNRGIVQISTINIGTVLPPTGSDIQGGGALLFSGPPGGPQVLGTFQNHVASLPGQPATSDSGYGIIPEAVLARLKARHRVPAWTVFGTLYGTRRIVAAAQKEVRKALSPLMSRRAASALIFISPERANALSRAVQKVPFVREGLGRSLATRSSSMVIVSGRPNQTALPLAYWRSGRRLDPAVQLDPGRDGCGLIWYAPLVEMKPDVVRRFVDMVIDVMSTHHLEPLVTLTSVSERCFVSSVPLLFDLASREETNGAHECLAALLEAGAVRGFLPYRVGGQSMEWLMNRAREHWQFVSNLKQAIDPNGIMSPGRYVPVAVRL